MKINELVFKFEEDKNEFSFSENLCLIDNKKLIKNLSRENIKNGNSSLIIKSMNDLPIYDVIQLKIRLDDTGSFLVNYSKENFTEEKRESLINKIKELKDNEEPTLEKQKVKISKLIGILNTSNPMFAVFRQNGDINIGFDDFKELTQSSFILLIIKNKEKAVKTTEKPEPIKEIIPEEKVNNDEDISETVVIKPLKDVKYTGNIVTPHPFVKNKGKILKENVDYVVYCDDAEPGEATTVIEFIGKYSKTTQVELKFNIVLKKVREKRYVKEKVLAKITSCFGSIKDALKKKPKKNKNKHKVVIDFPLFSFDYLFVGLFTLLFGFATYAGIFELIIKESIAVFLIILAAIFLGVLYFSFYSSTFKKRSERYKNLKYWLLLYVFVGAAIGTVAGYVITTFAITIPEDAVTNLPLLLEISIPSILVLSFISPFTSKLINLIFSKIKK